MRWALLACAAALVAPATAHADPVGDGNVIPRPRS